MIHGDTIGVLEIFFHLGNIVGDWLATLFAGDKLRNVVHRSRTIEGIHRDKVFEHCGLQFAQIFLHTRRLELESAGGAALAIELVGFLIGDIDFVGVDFNAVC